jgi:hypothetical protein
MLYGDIAKLCRNITGEKGLPVSDDRIAEMIIINEGCKGIGKYDPVSETFFI